MESGPHKAVVLPGFLLPLLLCCCVSAALAMDNLIKSPCRVWCKQQGKYYINTNGEPVHEAVPHL